MKMLKICREPIMLRSFLPRAASRFCELHGCVAARRRDFASKADAETYYSSQSGRVMRVPGSAGTRIHEVLPAEWAAMPQRVEMLKKLCRAQPDSCNLWPGALTELKSEGGLAEKKTMFAVDIKDENELQGALDQRAFVSVANIFVKCGDSSSLSAGLELAKKAKVGGLQVRAYVCDAFEDPDGAQTDPATVQDVVVAFADADADAVIISDATEKADPDSLRDVIEAALWVDVVGESMLERLGLRASLEMCMQASKLGVTRFDARLGPQVPGVAPTAELLRALDAAGRRHGMDAAQLPPSESS